MDYSLNELLDIPRLRKLLDFLDDINSVPSAIIDTEGTVLTATAWQEICTNFHRLNPDTEKLCIESDRSIDAKLAENTHHVIYRCPMGLVDAATPIIIEGKHLGNVFTGQLFMEPPDEAYFISQARKYGFNESQYLEAMRKVPLFPEESLRKNITFIHSLVQLLAEQGLQYKRQCEAEAILLENEAAILALKDTLQEQYEELQMNEESLRDQYDELLATEEMLRVQIENFEISQNLLRESEERFRALHDASFGGIFIHDEGIIVDCNQGLCDITGYSREELIGMNGFKFIVQECLDVVKQNIQSGFDQRYEVVGVRKDGSRYPLEICGKFIPFKGRKVRVIEFRDVTERKLAEESLHNEQLFSRTILDSLPGIFYLYSYPELRLIRWNKQHESLLGYEAGEIDGRHIFEWHVPEARQAVSTAVDNVMECGQFSLEAPLLTKDNRLVPFFLTGVKLEIQGKSYLLGTGINISELQKTEKELQKKNSEMEQFIYTVSHDLRSPLVTVKTFMGYLEKDMAEGNQEQLAQDIQFIHGAADKMKLLLDELLEMSRIDRVETPPVRVTFKEVVAEALEALAGIISEQNVNIHLSATDLSLFGDRPRFCQIWQNLIENAIKYTSADTVPHIEIGLEQNDGVTVFFVKDNGIGIVPQYHSKIFGIFDKLDPKSPGAGLGLSMVQRIVEKCGGSVWVESEGYGTGSSFFFTLPHAEIQG